MKRDLKANPNYQVDQIGGLPRHSPLFSMQEKFFEAGFKDLGCIDQLDPVLKKQSGSEARVTNPQIRQEEIMRRLTAIELPGSRWKFSNVCSIVFLGKMLVICMKIRSISGKMHSISGKIHSRFENFSQLRYQGHLFLSLPLSMYGYRYRFRYRCRCRC